MIIKNGKTIPSILNGNKPISAIFKGITQVYRKGLLPNGYTRLEYIASTGTQYIDTGLVGKSGYTIDTTISFTELSTGDYQYFAGYSYTGSADRTYFIRINNSSNHLGYTYGTNVVNKLLEVEENTFYNIKSVMKANKQELYVDGKKIGSSSYPALSYDAENPKNIYIFVSNYTNNTINGAMKTKCKEVKWYDENDNLVRHYIPCYRNSDNEIGMYDLVFGKFYTNQGEGEFVKSGSLPSEYQQVEYIEATGTQYLEIDYIADYKTNSKGKFQITDKSKANMLFGSRISATSIGCYGLNWGGGTPYKYYNTYYGNSNDGMTTTEIDENIHTFEKKRHQLYIDGELIHTRKDTDGNTEFATSYKMIVFGCNTKGTIGLFTYARIYDLQFYDEDVLAIDLIPCYRKSDNEIGMYDLVNDVFYTNKGTGTFLKGTNV